MACLNPECGATYGVAHEITHQISPSGIPDPTVLIRRTAPRKPQLDTGTDVLRTAAAAATLILPGTAGLCGQEVPPPANDDGTPQAVIGL